jgi:hypothetical protein
MHGKKSLPGAEEAVSCWSDCFAGGAVMEAGGGVVAHGRRLPAEATVSSGGATVLFSGFPLSSRFVFNFPTPFQAFPSFPIFRFLSLSVCFFWFVLSSLWFVSVFSCVFVFFLCVFSLVRPLFCLLLLLLTVFSAVNNVLPSLQRLRGGAGGRAWLGWGASPVWELEVQRRLTSMDEEVEQTGWDGRG